ncbi:hypothetical protein [Kitasatospora sp. NPDC050543]|uniref:hypothetical protein n=1 Tax=Kitasatospora sp. NPDC050543 TaxID=3364054 RepID=UPI00378FB51A
MRKHRLDPFSLIAGGLFTVIATLYLVASLNDFSVNGRVVIPLTLAVLGFAVLVAAVVAMARRGRRPAAAAPGAADAPTPPGPPSPPAPPAAPGAPTHDTDGWSHGSR